MRAEYGAKASAFAPVEGRQVISEFDGGAVTSDAGGLLSGAADKAIGLVDRLAGCFRDAGDRRFIERYGGHAGRPARVRHRVGI